MTFSFMCFIIRLCFPAKKERALRGFRKWSLLLKSKLKPIVNHCLFEAFITVCIICNTLLLALEHHGQSEELKSWLEGGNNVSFIVRFLLSEYLPVLTKYQTCEGSKNNFITCHALRAYQFYVRNIFSFSWQFSLWRPSLNFWHYRKSIFKRAGIFLTFSSLASATWTYWWRHFSTSALYVA